MSDKEGEVKIPTTQSLTIDALGRHNENMARSSEQHRQKMIDDKIKRIENQLAILFNNETVSDTRHNELERKFYDFNIRLSQLDELVRENRKGGKKTKRKGRKTKGRRTKRRKRKTKKRKRGKSPRRRR